MGVKILEKDLKKHTHLVLIALKIEHAKQVRGVQTIRYESQPMIHSHFRHLFRYCYPRRARCRLFEHQCQTVICEKSFVRKNIKFAFSILLLRKTTPMFTYSPEDYSIAIENSGSTAIWINSLHIDFSKSSVRKNQFFIVIFRKNGNFSKYHKNV